LLGQIGETGSGHGALPFAWLLLDYVLVVKSERLF
jgi:hypothetical protein